MNSFAILSLISTNKHTGPGVPALRQALLLKESGHQVTFACLPGGNLADLAKQQGLEVIQNLKIPRNGEVWQFPAARRTLKRELECRGIALLLVHRSAEMILAGLTVGGNQPILRIWHDGSGRPASRLLKMLMKRWHIQVAGTSTAASGAVGEVAKESTGRARVLPGGVDLTTFTPSPRGEEIRYEFQFDPNTVVVGLTARWKDGRGHEEFLAAFSAALKEAPNLRALLIGRGEREAELHQRIARLGIAHAVRLINPGDRFPEAVSACDIGILMAPGSDGQCRAGLEMMACGKPLILQDRGALRDLAGGEEESTLLVRDHSELVNALLRLSRDGILRSRMSEAARLRAERCFSFEASRRILNDTCYACVTGNRA